MYFPLDVFASCCQSLVDSHSESKGIPVSHQLTISRPQIENQDGSTPFLHSESKGSRSISFVDNGSQVRSFISSLGTPALCCRLQRSRGGSLGIAGPSGGDRASSGNLSGSLAVIDGRRTGKESNGMEEPLKKNYYCAPLRHRGPAASGIDRMTPDGYWKVLENRYALCYVYKTKQDGRQGNGNGNGRVNPQQPTDHHVGGGSSISAPPFEVFVRPEEESLLEMYLRTW